MLGKTLESDRIHKNNIFFCFLCDFLIVLKKSKFRLGLAQVNGQARLLDLGWTQLSHLGSTKSRSRPGRIGKKIQIIALSTSSMNSNKVVGRWWLEAYLLLLPGRGDRGGGVKNGGLWWPGELPEVAVGLSWCCSCSLSELGRENKTGWWNCWRGGDTIGVEGDDIRWSVDLLEG